VTISFYVPPRKEMREPLPERVEDYWPWLSSHRKIADGKYAWTLQTFLYLRAAGADVALVRSMPARGIVVSHRDFLPLTLVPSPNVFLVCIKPDRREHTWAHFYVVQNPNDKIFSSDKYGWRAADMPHWPQGSMIVRRPERGDRCEHVAYFGRTLNLAPEFQTPEWAAQLRDLGFTWTIVPHQRWHDYSDVDVTVAARAFGDRIETDPLLDPNSKPPSKLINSWLAGVPAVLGAESSFRNIRRHPLDYLEVTSTEALKAALLELRANPTLYRDMVAHGHVRAREFSAEAYATVWRNLFEDVTRRYERWMRRGPVHRQGVNLMNVAAFFANRQNLMGTRIHWR
jgi:hypothetical protein